MIVSLTFATRNGSKVTLKLGDLLRSPGSLNIEKCRLTPYLARCSSRLLWQKACNLLLGPDSQNFRGRGRNASFNRDSQRVCSGMSVIGLLDNVSSQWQHWPLTGTLELH